MIHGCNKNELYLTNPVEKKPLEEILNELTSESVLLVRRKDVIKRFIANNSNLADMRMFSLKHERWSEMNVLGQVVNVLRESNCISQMDTNEWYDFPTGSQTNINSDLRTDILSKTSHIKIPASYIPGITLFAYRDSNLYNEILGSTL